MDKSSRVVPLDGHLPVPSDGGWRGDGLQQFERSASRRHLGQGELRRASGATREGAIDELAAMAMDGGLGEAANRAIASLREAEHQRQEFLRSVAHDLRNPLSAVRGQAQLMTRRLRRDREAGITSDLARLQHGLEAIDAAAMRLSDLITRLLEPAPSPVAPERSDPMERA